MKHTLLAAAMALSVGALLAQAEPGGQDWPLTPITAAVADSETDAQTDIEAFLKDKDKNGFGAPINAGVNKKDDGSVFVVSTGIGIVAAPITQDEVLQAAGILINLLVALGILVDPTTSGITDGSGSAESEEKENEKTA